MDALDHLQELILDGKSVRLSDLGLFSIGMSSKAEDTKEKVTAASVEGVHLIVRNTKSWSNAELRKKCKIQEYGGYIGTDEEGTTGGGDTDTSQGGSGTTGGGTQEGGGGGTASGPTESGPPTDGFPSAAGMPGKTCVSSETRSSAGAGWDAAGRGAPQFSQNWSLFLVPQCGQTHSSCSLIVSHHPLADSS